MSFNEFASAWIDKLEIYRNIAIGLSIAIFGFLAVNSIMNKLHERMDGSKRKGIPSDEIIEGEEELTNLSQESPRAEKSVEIQNDEMANGVEPKGVKSLETTGSNIESHPDSLSKKETKNGK